MNKKDIKKFNASLKNSIEAGEMSIIDGTSSENLYTVPEAIEYLGVTPEELISCIENVGLNFRVDKEFNEFLFDFEDLETLLNEFILPKKERENRATISIEKTVTGGSYLDNWYNLEEAAKYLGITEDELICCMGNTDLEYLADDDFNYVFFYLEDLDILLKDFILPKRERESRATTDIEGTVTGGSYLDNWYNLVEAVEYLGITEDELICCMRKTDLEYLADEDFNYVFFYLEDLDIILNHLIIPKRERESRATEDIEKTITGDSFLDFWYTLEEAVEYLGIPEDEFSNYVKISGIEYLVEEDLMFLLFFREDLETLRNKFVLPKTESANG